MRPGRVVLALLAVAGCSASKGGTGSVDRPSMAAPDGYGASLPGEPAAVCRLSHSSNDDPIVLHGHDGGSHRHDFFGNTTTSSSSTAATLAAGGTTCVPAADRSAYWVPSLVDRGRFVDPLRAEIRTKGPTGSAPAGLALLAGHPASAAAPRGIVWWSCPGHPQGLADPAPCKGSTALALHLVFPDCWSGATLDSDDHSSHVAYSQGGVCPDRHPVAIGTRAITVWYPAPAPDAVLGLASGPISGAHGDILLAG